MFCKYCGNEVKEGTKFCTKCGQRILEDEERKETLSTNKEHRILQLKIIAIIASMVIGILFFGMSMHDHTINEDELKNLIDKEEIAKLDVGGTEMLLMPEKVSIISENKDEIANTYEVICRSTVSNEIVESDIQCKLTLEQQDKNWVIINSELLEILDTRPVKGVSGEYKERLIEVLKEKYPQIVFEDENVTYNITNHITKLEDKEDAMIYDYTIDTSTAYISGEVVIYYSFSKDGMWILSSSNNKTNSFEWKAEEKENYTDEINEEESISQTDSVIAQGGTATGIIEERFMAADANVGGMDTSYYVLVFDTPVSIDVYDVDEGGVYVDDNYGDGYKEIPISLQDNVDLSIYVGRRVSGNLTASQSYTRMGVTAVITNISVTK
jgi:predicted nucleic acid-binding Zn ribbon protein